MTTLGELLQKTRQDKGFSLAEAAHQTRLREHYLEAFENNDFEKLPSVVQGKGYLRIYSQFLDLDEKTLLDAWSHPQHLVIENAPGHEFDNIKEPIPEQIKLDSDENHEPNEIQIDNIEIDEGIPVDLVSQEEKIIHGNETELENKEIDDIHETKNSLSYQKFKTIGDKLQDQRIQLNLSLADIEHFTNIRSRYLEALENASLEKLPSIPQARGMLNNYSTFLNLDVDQIMIEFAEALQTRRNENYAPQRIGSDNQLAYQTPEVKKVGWLKFITMDLILTTSLIIGLFVFIIWGAANISGFQDEPQNIDAPSISEILLESTQEVTTETAVASEEIEITPTISQVTEGQNTEVDSEIGENEEAELVPELSGLPVQVYIIARQRAYLKVDVDGETVFTGRTIPGNAYEYSGSTSVELLTGNAAALEIYYNLNPIGAFGNVGEVKSLLFTSATGLITPTPRFTPEPLMTLQPSITPQPTSTPTNTPPTPSPTVTQLIP